MSQSQLIRLSRIDTVPIEQRLFSRATLYKWHHLRRFPRLFVKIAGAVFVDMNVLAQIIESSRGKVA